ncbi:MAG: aminopeptidase, partial [Spirochaetales bacterium]|nr:aminopeptidase [Candidatus Physcosoma equi]
MKKSILRKYAHLLATYGINVQKGQDVWIVSSVETAEFAALCAEECYKAGARKVLIDWSYQPMTKLNVAYMEEKDLSTYDSFELAKWKYRAEKLPCMLYLDSEDPNGLDGVDVVKMGKGLQARRKKIKKLRDSMEGKDQWCIAGVPGKAWAKKLFPELSTSQAVEKLWEKILQTSRVTEDPVASWKAHDEDLKKRSSYLNGL